MGILKRYNGTNWEQVSTGIGEVLPIGTILPFANDIIPDGYLLCDGSEVSRTTYADLFALIGTTYGTGDGSTTFNLPSLKGRVPVGYSSGDTDFGTLGKKSGSKSQSLRALIGAINGNTKSIGYQATDPVSGKTYTMGTIASSTTSVSQVSHSTVVCRTDGANATTIQPYTVVNYIIKVAQTSILPTTAQVINTYSTSETNSYSANYINNMRATIYNGSQNFGNNLIITIPEGYSYIDVYVQSNYASGNVGRGIVRIDVSETPSTDQNVSMVYPLGSTIWVEAELKFDTSRQLYASWIGTYSSWNAGSYTAHNSDNNYYVYKIIAYK